MSEYHPDKVDEAIRARLKVVQKERDQALLALLARDRAWDERLRTDLAATRAELARVVEAWTNPGPRPDVHERAKAALAGSWPTLYEALAALDRKGEQDIATTNAELALEDAREQMLGLLTRPSPEFERRLDTVIAAAQMVTLNALLREAAEHVPLSRQIDRALEEED